MPFGGHAYMRLHVVRSTVLLGKQPGQLGSWVHS